MSTYRIVRIEKAPPTKSGKEFSNATLEDMNGSITDKVKIWADFPGYFTLSTGSELEGDIRHHEKFGASISAQHNYPQRNYNRPPNTTQIAQTRVETSIKASHEARSEGVKLGMAFRDATVLLTELYGDSISNLPPSERETEWQSKHRSIRRWLMEEFDKEKNELDYPTH